MLIKSLLAFIFGGAICAAVQIIIDKTNLTPPRILVGLVFVGALLGTFDLYEPLFEIFGAGISVPLIGFGANVIKGVKEEVDEFGPLGIFTGGFNSAAIGCSATLIFAYLFSLIFGGKPKRL